MSTERPFGDPTNIQRENAAAVGKGVAFGCGGCMLAVVLVIGAFVVFAFGVLYFISQSGPGDMAFEAAKKSEILREALGEPMEKGWFVNGNVSINNNSGKADLTIPVSGPKGSAEMHIIAEMKEGIWHFSEAKATISGRTDPVDLRPLLKTPASAGAPAP